MNAGHVFFGRFQVRSTLAAGSRNYLVTEIGRRGRPAWVLRPLPVPGGSPLREVLRADILDLASLSHPALAMPVSFGRDHPTGLAFVLRRYLEGSEICSATQGLAPRELFPWLIGATEALELLHRHGSLHRNLKPSNFIVPRPALHARSDRGPRVILCDPAWWAEEAKPPPENEPRAPELKRSERATFASDLYCLGIIFYRLLTRRGLDLDEGGFPVPPRELMPEISIDLDRLVMKLLSPDPSRRYQESRAVREDLRRLSGLKPASVPIPAECFLDRRVELDRAVARLARKEARVALAVTGEAGMGKSCFLRRLALEAQLLGYQAVFVRAYSEKAAPFSALRAIAERLLPAGPAGRSLRSRYRRLLKEKDTPRESGTPDVGRHRAFVGGLLDLFARAASTQALILVDEVHLADPLTIEFLAALVRDIAGSSRRPGKLDPAPLSLAVSFRTESPFRAALGPLLEALGSPGGDHLVLELGQLSPETVERWLDLALADAPDKLDRIRIASQFEGQPFAIRECLCLGGSRLGEKLPFPSDISSLHFDYLASLDCWEKQVLEALAVLGRPAEADLLGAVLSCPASRLRSCLGALQRAGTLNQEGERFFFQHGSFYHWLLESLGEERRRSLHRRIASVLAEGGEAPVDEVAHHWLRSDAPAEGAPAILAAARQLAKTQEEPRALAFYEAALELVPSREGSRKWELAEEVAEAHARAGQYRRGIEILKALLEERSGGLEAGRRLHGRLGVLHHRAGEPALAALHLEKGLSLLSGAREDRWLPERLRIESELAEIWSNQGDYDRAEAICCRALESLAGSPGARGDREVRRLEMVLLETLAHLRLRRFQYPEARELFEKSLRISEELGAVPEKSLILNNLGILHNQENRFSEAIECYQRAHKLSARQGEDPILANIHSNLALLYAKTGEPEAAGEALRWAAHHDARCDSGRIRFLRLHATGIVDLYCGRYASGIEAFKAAIALGEELKDHYVVAYDLAYLGECHLFRGEARAARAAFERALGLDPGPSSPLRAMVEARQASLAALRGEMREARAFASSGAARTSGGVPYLDAWNRVFLGWAQRLLGAAEDARKTLQGARAFFSRYKVPAGEIHCELELAALEADGGSFARAQKRLGALRARTTCGRGALKSPMLSARLLAYQARLFLDQRPPDAQEAASCLVEAESFLIGHHLRDLEVLARDLRRRLRLLDSKGPRALFLPLEQSSLPGLELARSFLEPAADLVKRIEEQLGEARTASLRRDWVEVEERFREMQRALESGAPAPAPAILTSALLGNSAAICKLKDLVRQIAPTALPVLITGETGTGKELVARAIHGESRRAGAPFVSVHCATLPPPLLEAELFGYRRGAFSGAENDHAGLLSSAQGGTFFFDEIGEMPLELQGKLLRLLDGRRLRPLGGTDEIEIDVRYLFATNRQLSRLAEEGEFRRDLFFRLSSLEVAVPPLRERLEDLPILVSHFSELVGLERSAAFFGDEALRALAAHPWPGNVRELQTVVTRMAVTSGGRISSGEVRSFLERTPVQGLFPPGMLRTWPLGRLHAQLEREYFVQLHTDHGGDLKAMASALGISFQALYKRFKSLGIRPRDLRG
jgi:DNA-binding NtrC family response regulator/Tfp pilus assembly protein PilF